MSRQEYSQKDEPSHQRLVNIPLISIMALTKGFFSHQGTPGILLIAARITVPANEVMIKVNIATHCNSNYACYLAPPEDGIKPSCLDPNKKENRQKVLHKNAHTSSLHQWLGDVISLNV